MLTIPNFPLPDMQSCAAAPPGQGAAAGAAAETRALGSGEERAGQEGQREVQEDTLLSILWSFQRYSWGRKGGGANEVVGSELVFDLDAHVEKGSPGRWKIVYWSSRVCSDALSTATNSSWHTGVKYGHLKDD